MAWIAEAAICLAGALPAGSRMVVLGSQARRHTRGLPPHQANFPFPTETTLEHCNTSESTVAIDFQVI